MLLHTVERCIIICFQLSLPLSLALFSSKTLDLDEENGNGKVLQREGERVRK